jgi:hypothetical protein
VNDEVSSSERLHARVRAFAAGQGSDSFETLAWDIARFQRDAVACTRGLWGVAPYAPADATFGPLSRLPAVPVEALRTRAVFPFAANRAARVFHTSGTTSAETGRHYFRTTATYEAIALLTGKSHLLPGCERALVLALMPFAAADTHSSLSFMAQCFMDTFDAPGVSRDACRWLVEDGDVDVRALRRWVAQARHEGRPVLLLATSFALLALLDRLEEPLSLPPGSVVMPTGGFKGRSRSVDPEWLRAETSRRLGPVTVVHEYGMTELSSQLYERTAVDREASPGLYFEGRTIRVIATDPVTLEPVRDGEVGLASFVDLGNVDSAVRVLSQDRVVREGGGIRLLGRSEQAPLRGCSLVAESLVARPRRAASAVARLTTGRRDPLALARVRRLVAAARVLADAHSGPGKALRAELALQGPLSAAGVEYALLNCLETNPSDQELAALVDSVAPAERAFVVQSANVFVAAHRAIALALAASADVRVRPSRRDPSLTRALSALAPDLFQVVNEITPGAGDHVFAYGSDATLEQLERDLPQGVVFHPHGDGIGVVWLTRRGEERALALDVAAFDQRGCASPRVVALHESVEVEPFVESLTAALAAVAVELPQGASFEEERAATSQFRALAEVCADRVVACGPSLLAIQREPERVLLPPVGRHLVIVTGERALDLLLAASARITTVGVAGDESELARVARLFPRARVCPVGRMQRPRFDGPLDRR